MGRGTSSAKTLVHTCHAATQAECGQWRLAVIQILFATKNGTQI